MYDRFTTATPPVWQNFDGNSNELKVFREQVPTTTASPQGAGVGRVPLGKLCRHVQRLKRQPAVRIIGGSFGRIGRVGRNGQRVGMSDRRRCPGGGR
jgi:hypothetical protein